MDVRISKHTKSSIIYIKRSWFVCVCGRILVFLSLSAILNVIVQKYLTKARQTGAAAESVKKSEGVEQMEALLRRERPRFDPPAVMDSHKVCFVCYCAHVC